MNEKSTWNSTWQTWMMLDEYVGEVFKTIVEGRHGGNFDFRPPKNFGLESINYSMLSSKKMRYHYHFIAMA
jgi:hypothetical protein